MSLARFRCVPLVLALVVFGLASPRSASAQAGDTVAVADTLREIRLADGSVVYGRIVAGEVQVPDPNPSRLFFAPTGRPLFFRMRSARSADAGLGAAVGEDAGCCIPLVNFVYTFGGSR